MTGTRIVILEVKDVRAEDLLIMAMMSWDDEHPEEPISAMISQRYSFPVGDPAQF